MDLRHLLVSAWIAATPLEVLAQEPTPAPASPLEPASTKPKSTLKTETQYDFSLKYGRSWRKDVAFEERRFSAGIERLLIELDFRKEIDERTHGSSLSVAGIHLEGQREFQTYQVNFIFGYALIKWQKEFLDARLYGQVMGGVQLDKNVINVEGTGIPGDPKFDFPLGTGIRLEVSYPFSHWTHWPVLRSLGLGAGVFVEYLSPQVEDIKNPPSAVFYGGYGLVRIGNGK